MVKKVEKVEELKTITNVEKPEVKEKKVVIPEVKYHNGVEILSQKDENGAILLTLANGTTTFIEKE